MLIDEIKKIDSHATFHYTYILYYAIDLCSLL